MAVASHDDRSDALTNADLAPTGAAQRTWNWWHLDRKSVV